MKLIPQNYSLWLSSMKHERERVLPLKEKYDPERYPMFDTYEAINVDSLKEIPIDYYGEMGVPQNIFRYSLADYEIVGKLQNGRAMYDYGKPMVNDKEKYVRIIIKRK